MGIPTIPDFTGPLTPNAITEFFNICTDTFEIWDTLNPNPKLTDPTKVRLVGIHLKEPSTAQFWNGNRSEFVTFSISKFEAAFRHRFLHSNQQLDTLRRFFSINQGDRDYRAFVAELKLGREVVNRAVSADPITNDQYNQHLVFHADPALIARVMTASTNADIIKKGTNPQTVIEAMIKEWDALQAVRQAAGGAAPGTGFGPADTYAGPPASSSVGPLGAQHMIN